MKPPVSIRLLAAMALVLIFGAACTKQATEAQNPDPAPQQGALPMGHPPVGEGSQEPPTSAPVATGADQLSWETPTGWIEEPPANAMRQAQYLVPGEGGDGQCVVFYFGAGQGGGVHANADRWADQFSQPDGSSSRDARRAQLSAADSRMLRGDQLSLVSYRRITRHGTANAEGANGFQALRPRPWLRR